MVVWWGKKQRRLILAAYMVIVIIGVFTFSSLESFQSIKLREDKPISGSFFMSINHDFLAESITLVGRAKGYSPSPLRGGFLRIGLTTAMYGGKVFVLQHFIENNESAYHPRIKNAILLKLRI
jgi:hypothetical protein